MREEQEIFGHPKGLYICFLTEMWERFSFYGMKFLLLLYLTKYHLFTDGGSLDVLGAYAGLVYALPVIGGMLADRYLGMRKAVIFGGIMLCFGHLGLAFEGDQATMIDGIRVQDDFALNIFYLSLALIIVGVGFLKPNISTIVGKLYEVGDKRRDSGFTIFYMGINLGSFTATLLCGYLGENYGWGYGFGLAGIGMLFGLVVFLWGQRFLHGHAEPEKPEVLKENGFLGLNKEVTIYVGSLISVPVIWFLVQSNAIVHNTLNAMAFGVLVWLIWFLFKECDRVERGRMTVLASLTLFTVVFWALFEQSAASMTLYADRVVDRVLIDTIYLPGETLGLYLMAVALIAIPILVVFLGRTKFSTMNDSERKITGSIFVAISGVLIYLGIDTILFAGAVAESAAGLPVRWEVTAVQTGSLNAMFIFLLAPLFAWLWTFLSRNKMEPGTPLKFGLGILQAGLGFGALVLGATMPDASGKVAYIWIVLAYLLHTTGELCLSPVGLSAVTKLSVPKVVGFMMGVWFLATAYSELVAAQLAKFAAIDTEGGIVTDVAAASTVYADFFSSLMWVGVAISLVLFVLTPLMKKGMHGVK
ncbi:peptide MFS transporter [Reichenbachiella carrageenanivorans]|uniref:Peptide MFS transporter n=1 Tax=Reichenbachiella carrageenanivorans TaxID=2979869 RepID=A0ABY6CYC3_9BACT|nr:peptide MFS transporter [Reichenbachiella carrageenanivorans]UXX78912.1 peptide MFS transporter [Reichenbachiella carrageenanivorans]